METPELTSEMNFTILGSLQLRFCSSINDDISRSVVWCPVQSELQDDNADENVEEFNLTNFTGRIIVKRRHNREIVTFNEEVTHLRTNAATDASTTTASIPSPTQQDSRHYAAGTVQGKPSLSIVTDEDQVAEQNAWHLSSVLEQPNSPNSPPSIGLKSGPGSPLHTLCAAPSVKLDELRACLAVHPRAPFVTNIAGQTPLFLLTDNDNLWYDTSASDSSSSDAHTFALELVNINPAALAMTDCEDVWPCYSILSKWIEQQYANIDNRQGNNMLSNVLRNVGTAVSSPHFNARNSLAMTMQRASDAQRRTKMPRAHVTPAFESALAILSLSFESRTTTQELSPEQQLELRQLVCSQIAAELPRFLSTLFLLEPESVRHRIFKLPFVKRLLLEPATVGPWLVTMVRRKGILCRRAVDYLELLSHSTINDFVPEGVVDLDVDEGERDNNIVVKKYRESKVEVLNAIGDMGALIPSLFVLEEREIHRVTSVSAIWHIMQHVLRRPFIIGIVMIDFVLHLTLMLSFRSSLIQNDMNVLAGVPTRVVSAITSFYVVRKISEGIALWTISKTVFRSYFLDIWNLFDTLAITLVIVADAFSDRDFVTPGFNSFILILLWLKVLAFLKAVNLQMATFILSLIRIVIDIRFFMVVLIVFIMMFGDIMTIIFTTTVDEDGRAFLCNGDSDPQQDFCSSSNLDSYLRMYGVLIGDFELNDYREGSAVTIVFLVFTLVGVIILLNVLIAVVSDSYEKATARAKSLFGRARVGFLAEHMALEQFLQPGSNPLRGIAHTDLARDPRKCFPFISRVVRWLVLMGLLVTALFAEVFLVGQAIIALWDGGSTVPIAVFMVAIAFVLTVGLWVVIYDLLTKMTVGRNYPIPVISHFLRFVNWFMDKAIDTLRALAFGDFGIDSEIENW